MDTNAAVEILQQFFAFLKTVGADGLVVGVTAAICMIMRYYLPGPVDSQSGARLWIASPVLERYLMPAAPFVIGVALELVLDTFKGNDRFCVDAIRGGLSTGAWSLAAERVAYKMVFGK